jgi:hypothetical protein
VDGVLESWGLFHIDGGVETTIQEGCSEVNLTTFPIADGQKATDHAEGFQAESWREKFVVIETLNLGVPHCEKACFQLLDGTIRSPFNLKNPLGLDDFTLVRLVNKTPSLHA